MARLQGTSWMVGEGPADPAGARSHQARSQGPRAGRNGWKKTGLGVGAEAADGSRSAPAGLGLHLRPQLLPLCPGHVLHPAAAQGQQEGRKCRAPRQAGLLHPLLCLHLTVHPGSEPRPALSPACRERPVLPDLKEHPSSEPEASPGLWEAQAGRFLRIHLLGLYWVLSTTLERKEFSPFS